MTLARLSSVYPGFLDKFFDEDFMNFRNKNYSPENTTLPSVNIKEDKDGFEVELAVPGYVKKDFKIELNNNVLTVSSDKQVENEVKEDQQFTRREFSYQSFKRSFTLPEIVESDKITASYEKGLLKIQIPKKDEAKPKPIRCIDIK